MKAYYELSYIDAFGNGDYSFFYCTEEQIKEKAKDLFNVEVKFAIDESELAECGMSKKTFEFDEQECKGYIVKEVGFTLPHQIDWKKLPFDPLNKNIKNVYVLESQCQMTSSWLGTYSNLKEAKKQMKEQLEKPFEIAKTGDDGARLPNGIAKKTKYGYVCSYFFWSKTSYEYDEWDVEANTNTLTVRKIERLK